MPSNSTFSGFGGGGRGPTIVKELAIVFGAWVAIKTSLRNNKRPPPPENPNTRFKQPLPEDLYKYEKRRLIAHFTA